MSILRGNTGMLDLEAENQQLWDELGNLSGEIGDYQQRLEALRSQNNKLLSKLESQREMNDYLKKEMEEIFTQFSALSRCDETCPSFDLCRKRILIVGGINRMESLYRQWYKKRPKAVGKASNNANSPDPIPRRSATLHSAELVG